MLSEKASDAAEKGSILDRWTNWCATRSDKTGSGTQLAVAMQLPLIGDHKGKAHSLFLWRRATGRGSVDPSAARKIRGEIL